ncbi:hypothetical protein SDC9_95015 [bioreactor metagenome]|uniref:Uncharacterized protein n=1 Tax=bioreactor metagenome TaxID=1076179 RepID=A0A645A7M8_9ZZZZ
MSERFYLLCKTIIIHTVKGFYVIVVFNPCFSTANRTAVRYTNIAASCDVVRNLWNYHICLVNCYGIAYAKIKIFHNA